jgi:DNA mismatch endonuclease (patch repair protein)
MSAIRSKNTRPERTVRRWLHAQGFRFRIHDRQLPGVPDIVLPKYRTAIEVRGCFWHHHHKCRNAAYPRSNRTYWRSKLEKTRQRDRDNQLELEKRGWKVVVIWECQIDEIHLTRVADLIRALA